MKLVALLCLILCACSANPATGTPSPIQASETAIALQSTRAVGDLQATAARATAETIRLQTTAGYLVQYGAAMSTATAIVNERELAILSKRRQADRANALRWIGITFTAGLSAWSIAALAVSIDIMRRRSLADAAWRFYRASQVAELPASLPPDNGRQEMTVFLRQAADAVGRDATVIPRYDVMQTSAERWTRITDILQSMGLLVKIKGRGSYIRLPYRTVGGLYQAVASGKLQIAPLPTGNVRQYWSTNGEQNRTEAQDE